MGFIHRSLIQGQKKAALEKNQLIKLLQDAVKHLFIVISKYCRCDVKALFSCSRYASVTFLCSKSLVALLGSVVFSPTWMFEVSVLLSTGRGDGVGENFAPDYQI